MSIKADSSSAENEGPFHSVTFQDSVPEIAFSRRPAAAPSDPYETFVYNAKSNRGRPLLKDRLAVGRAIPQLLPRGLTYAANYISFEELKKRGALHKSKRDEVHLTADEVHLMYEAKCIDQNLVPSWEREVRFMELVSHQCRGSFFSMPENGIGPHGAEAIAHILSSNPHYCFLDLSGNLLRDKGAQHVAELLRANETLVHVSLSSNDLSHEGGTSIIEALADNNTVVSLDLGTYSGANCNHIGTRGAEALGQLLQSNKVLAKLNLSSNGLGSSGMSFIASGLLGNHSLTHIDISRNNLGYEGARVLASLLEHAHIVHLSARWNAFGDKGGRVLFQAIAEVIDGGVDILEHLHLESNDFGERTAQMVQRVLVSSTALRELRLTNNGFGSAVKHIADGLSENRHLTSLHLSGCDIRETDGVGLGCALAANTVLRTLDLSKNKLKDIGAKEVAKGLSANRVLFTLNLANNKIGDVGGEALAAALLSNHSLHHLNLRRNAMSCSTGNLLFENLRSNPAVESMDVTYNDFSYKCFIGIREILDNNAKANKQRLLPQLIHEIDTLAPKEKELMHIEEEIEMEKRIIKDRGEQLLRQNEEARVVSEKMRRDAHELDTVFQRVRSSCEDAEEVFRRAEEATTTALANLALKRGGLETRVQQERERVERLQRDMERMRRQIKQIQEAENGRLAPLLAEVQTATLDCEREMGNAKFEAEKLASLALRKKDLVTALSAASGKGTKKIKRDAM